MSNYVLTGMDIAKTIEQYRSLLSGFEGVLQSSRGESHDAPEGYLWQDPWDTYWKPFRDKEEVLYRLGELVLDPMLWEEVTDEDRATVESCTDAPREARVEGILTASIFSQNFLGEDKIAYSEADILKWREAFAWWVDFSDQTFRDWLSRKK